MLNVDPSVISALQGNPAVSLLQTGASNSMTVSMWVDTPPFDDVRVREALKLVVDRQAMVDTVLLGFGQVAADNPVPLANPASFVTEAPKQDYEKARALLAEAGHADGLKFDLYTAEGVPGMVRMAQVFAEQAKPAGIEINVIVTPAESYWDDVWLKKPIVTSAWSMRPPGEGLAVAYVQTAKWKETHWERPDYDAMLQKANTTVDTQARLDLYKQAAKTLATEGGLIRGGVGPDTLNGDPETPILEGGAGNDTLNAGSLDSLLIGGAGNDALNGAAGDDLLAGGVGNDTIETGAGSNVVAFNSGGGEDTVWSDAGASNTLSLGGGLRYQDLSLSKDGDDLVLNAGGGDSVRLKEWYNGKDTIDALQLVLDATNEFDANSSDPLYNRRVQTFDFQGLVGQFDQALAASPGLSSWAVTNALLQFHLSGVDNAAIGGDLAYWYGRNNGFTGIGLAAAQAAIGAPGFGSEAQTLHAFSGLQEGLVRLA